MQVIDIFNNNLIFQNTFMTFWQILILPYFTKTSVKFKKKLCSLVLKSILKHLIKIASYVFLYKCDIVCKVGKI